MTYTKQTRARGSGEGNIYQRASDGLWVGRLSAGTGPDGRRLRRWVSAKTRKACVERLTAAKRALEQGVSAAPARLTVGEFLRGWMEGKANLRPATRRRYEQIVSRALIPGLGQHRLAQMQPTDVDRFLRAKAASGLAPRTVNHYRTVLRSALHDAERHSLVVRNVAALAQSERVAHEEIRALAPAEINAMLAAAQGDSLEPLLTVAVTTGLRQGELLGLRWAEVDLDSATLRVRQALQRGVFVEPKTARSRRSINLPERATAALRRQRALQAEQRLAAGRDWHDNGLVFASNVGTPLDGVKVTKRFQALLARAGLPPMRFHDLRHCAATLLIHAGVDMRVVMEVLGHSTIATTMNLYAHVLPAAKEAAAQRLDALLGSG